MEGRRENRRQEGKERERKKKKKKRKKEGVMLGKGREIFTLFNFFCLRIVLGC